MVSMTNNSNQTDVVHPVRGYSTYPLISTDVKLTRRTSKNLYIFRLIETACKQSKFNDVIQV